MNNQSPLLIANNSELRWSGMLSYREGRIIDRMQQRGLLCGYFELRILEERVNASYFGISTVAQRTSLELSIANSSVGSAPP